MTFFEEISALQERLARAHMERDTWRATGMQEKYLEAHSIVDALEMQLDALRQEGLRNSSRSEQLAVVSAVPDVAEDREVLMARFFIRFDGRQYQYDRYRYDRLEDALSYARLRRATPSAGDKGVPLPAARTVRPPDGAQRQLMRTLSITFEEGIYRLGAYRYDRLADAINYAHLLRGGAG